MVTGETAAVRSVCVAPTDPATVALAVGLIKQLEGWRAKAYRDEAGVWTVGWGRTEAVDPTTSTTVDAETRWLTERVTACAEAIELRISNGPRLPPECWAALISWTYNVVDPRQPIATLKRTTWWKSKIWMCLATGQLDKVSDVLAEWVKVRDPVAGGLRVSRGLINRRRAEVDLWRRGLASMAIDQDGYDPVPDVGDIEGDEASHVWRTDTVRGSAATATATAASGAVMTVAPQLLGLDWRVAVVVVLVVALAAVLGVYYWRSRRV